MKALDNNENNEILEENAENQDELVLDEDIELDKDMNTKVTEEYDASQIQVLEGLEAVRSAPVCTLARRVRAACTTLSMK